MTTLPLDRPHPLRPPPAYADLRPVARVRTADGRTAWLVTGFDTAATVLSDPRFGITPTGEPQPGNDTLFQDGEPHARLRRLVARVFTPRRVDALREQLHADAHRRVEQMLDAGGPADLIDAVAAPLAIDVIARLLGVAPVEVHRFRSTVGAALTDWTPDRWARMQAFVAELVEAKRTRPDDDLLSDLIATRDADDGRLSGAELVAMAGLLVVAGYQPVSGAIAIGTMVLLDAGRLTDFADPTRRDRAIEELLRCQAGLNDATEPMPRFAHEPVELAGVSIAAGEMVLVRLEAAHRDPHRFPDPDSFDPDREAPPHMTFGRGPHHCLGAALGRLEVSAVLRALAERVPELRLATAVEDVVWDRGYVDSGPSALIVTW